MSAPPTDPAAVLRSRSYVGLLVVGAILGVLISAAAYRAPAAIPRPTASRRAGSRRR